MSATRVVRIRRKGGLEVVSCDVYIGRPMYQGGWRLPGSKWANSFKVTPKFSREMVVAAYEDYVRSSPELMACLPDLEGMRLGCWCAPLPCHGDVLVKLLRKDDAPQPILDNDPIWAALGI